MSKNDPVAVKPFPWKCRTCKKPAVYAAIVDHSIDVDHDGRVYQVDVKGLKTPQCRECQAVFPDANANRRITLEFLRQAKLLTPQEIREHREALGLTQKQFASLLGFAEATISRWETGAQIQQRSLDNLLRIFFGFPEVRKHLAECNLLDLGLVPELESVSS